MGKIWGTVPINDQVYDEIIRRQNLMGTKYKTAEQLSCLNANDPWVVLRTGVNVDHSTGPAQTYTLVGGRAQGFDEGVGKVSGRKGISLTATKGEEGSYYNGNFGFRPMPGITSVSIRNRDTWGAVQEATVNFVVHSLDDLDNIDNVYFRPGFTAVLEWGWTLTWDGNKMVTDTPSLLPFFGKELLPELQQQVGQYENPNHGILLGYVTNFSYALQKDGTYNCWVKILGTGSVLEGMKILPASKGRIKYEKKSDSGDEDRMQSWMSPIYTAVIEGTNKPGVSNLKEILKDAGCEGLDAVQDDVVVKNGELVDLSKIETVTYSVFLSRKWYGAKRKENVTYIKLNDLMKLFNGYGMHINKTPFRFATRNDKSDDGYLIYDNDYISSETLFSLDPFKVIVPTRQDGVIEHSKPDKDGHYSSTNVELVDGLETPVPDGTVGKILDIWVSLNWIYDIIQSEIDQNDEEFLTVNCINGMLGGINKAFGNTTNIEVTVDEKRQRWYFVDRNYIEKQGLKQIVASGLRTTFLDIEAESNISSEMCNEMSVAAQGGKDISPALTSWNYNLSERHPMEDRNDLNNQESDDDDWATDEYNMDQFWEDAQTIYAQMFDGKKGKTDADTSELSETAYQKIQLAGEALFSEAIEIESNCGSGMPVGVFPLKLGFTMRGIQGFIVGEVFGVEEGILPRKYKDWGYIVTGVEHQIDTNGWTTKVKTQYYPNNLENSSAGYIETGRTDKKEAPNSGGGLFVKTNQSSKKSSTDNTKMPTNWNYKIFANASIHSKVFKQDPTQFLINQGCFSSNANIYPGKCARGTYTYCTLVTTPESNWSSVVSKGGSLKHAGGNANETGYFNNILARGYSEIGSGTEVTVAEIYSAATVMKPGDIICYWGGPEHKYHTCMKRVLPRTVRPDCEWVSDTLQTNMFCYTKYRPGNSAALEASLRKNW